MGLSLDNVSGGTGHVRECRAVKLALSFHLKESVGRRRRLAKLARVHGDAGGDAGGAQALAQQLVQSGRGSAHCSGRG